MFSLKKYCLLLLVVVSAVPMAIASNFTVVIDAGHGGKDAGAIGTSISEKNINLAVALKLGEMIERNLKDVKVVYTRKTDKFITLQERANIANRAKGNLFISIHTNSVDKKAKNRTSVKGSATYTLGLHKTAENLAVAKRENSVMVLENNYKTAYQGFDPNLTESYIIFEINQNKHVAQSVDFASNIQAELVKMAGRTDNGVRQAGFWVLAQTSMPAVLVELDFICNPTQEAFMGSVDGQKKLAQSIYSAFCKYKKSNDIKVATISKTKLADVKAEKKQVAPIEPVSEDEGNEKFIDASSYKYSTKRQQTKRNKTSATAAKGQSVAQNKSSKAPKKESPILNDTSSKNKKTVAKRTVEQVSVQPIASDIVYKIQFLTSMKKLSLDDSEMKGLSPVSFYQENGLYKYTYGETTDKEEAKTLLSVVKLKFKGAFVVPFKDNKRISVY